MFKHIENIIFDFDGTLGDTKDIHKKAFLMTFEPFNINFDYHCYEGLDTKKIIEYVSLENNLNLNCDEINDLISQKQLIANNLIKSDIKFIKHANIFLNVVKDRNISLFIGSSGSKNNVIQGINSLDIFSFFQDITTKEDVIKQKPDPEIYDLIIEKHKLDKSKTLVIEDSIPGINAAINAKIICNCVEENLFDNSQNLADFNYNYLKLIELFKDN